MSGALSSISALAGQASNLFSAVNTLFGGAGGVQLGSVTFSDIEVPEFIKWGGKQDIVKQRLPGGVNVFNAMGIEFPPITWGGIFEGFGALDRSREIYAMLVAALLVPLSWNDRSYTVMVADYEADDTKSNWIPYHVTCLVLRDETLSQTDAPPSLLSQVTSDIAGAIGITPAQLTAGVGTALQVAQTAATVVGAVTAGSKAALGLTSAIGLATTAVNVATGIANSGIAKLVTGALTTGAPVLPAGSALSGVSNMAAALTNSSNLAALPIIGGLLGRVTNNMSNAST